MHDNWLIAIAMATSALGISGLLFALIMMDAPQASIDGATRAEDGTSLRIQGSIKSVQQKGNLTILRVTQTCGIDVIVRESVNLTAGSCIVVQGKRSSYKDSPQLDATRVSRCQPKSSTARN